MKRIASVAALMLLFAACGSDEDMINREVVEPNEGSYFNFVTPLGVQVECRVFVNNTECWPVQYP